MILEAEDIFAGIFTIIIVVSVIIYKIKTIERCSYCGGTADEFDGGCHGGMYYKCKCGNHREFIS